MTIELLAKQGAKKVYTNLAGRTYQEIMFKHKAMHNQFSPQMEQEHQREVVAKIKDVKYINDAFSINTNITWFTMEQISSRIVWIVEDDNSQQDYNALLSVSREKVVALICYGKNIEKLRMTFQGIIPSILPVNNINDAALLASAVAQENDVVLFSPANGTKEDIEKRGVDFRKAVNNL
ncbi:MAG: hypothetical protein PHN41_00860 [Bacteroidales bacterium]|jgi:UDP-N-acetylmuramoylalanine--D-glutamate ligase|nr:hypothetical protein [Bacteroidales bacterium]MDD4703529.1 hypothetical protein [Bacteroidales bacterium]MDX9798321.1 hypothetical protein [Bacteroidales bacterium]